MSTIGAAKKEMRTQARMQQKLAKIAEDQEKMNRREERLKEKFKAQTNGLLTKMLKKRLREEKELAKIQKRELKLQKREGKKTVN